MVVYRGIDMNKKLKYSLHSFSNRMTLPCLGVMFTIAYYFIYRDAYNEVLRWIGIASLANVNTKLTPLANMKLTPPTFLATLSFLYICKIHLEY